MSFIEFKQQKSGDVVISFESPFSAKRWIRAILTPLARLLLVTFQSLDAVTGKRTWLGLCLALALGISSGMVIFSAPNTASAENVNVTEPIEFTRDVESLTFRGVSAPIRPALAEDKDKQGAVLLVTGTGLVDANNRSSLISVPTRHYLSSELQEARLGETVAVLGTNNGVYNFTVTETRVVATQSISNVISQLDPAIVLALPVDIWQQETLLLVARPRQ